MVVHDLAFRAFPETAPQVDARWLRRFDGWLRDGAAIIVPSEAARADLVELERVEPERVHVVHHGVDAESFRSASPEDTAQARRRFGLGEAPYVLFVGGIEPRKNLEALVGAFASLGAASETRLVIAGGQVRWIRASADRLRAKIDALPSGVRERVILTGYVSDAERVALLGGATALAYPSLYEGFGFPIGRASCRERVCQYV